MKYVSKPDPNKKVTAQLRAHYHKTGRHWYCSLERCAKRRAGIEEEEGAKMRAVNVPTNPEKIGEWLDKVNGEPQREFTIEDAYEHYVNTQMREAKNDPVVQPVALVSAMIGRLDHFLGVLHELQASEAALSALRDTDKPTEDEMKIVERWESAGEAYINAVDSYQLDSFCWATHKHLWIKANEKDFNDGR